MSYPIPPKFPLERLSVSVIKQFLQCERKYQYQFIDHLAPRKYQSALEFGTIGHKFLERFYKTTEFSINSFIEELKNKSDYSNFDADSMQKYVLDIFVLSGMIKAYIEYYKLDKNEWDILYVEEDFTLGHYDGEAGNPGFYGKPDLVVREKKTGRIYVIDHKFYSRISDSLLKKLPMDYQLHSYIKMVNIALEKSGSNDKVYGAIYNIIQKSGKRLKKNQTIEELAKEMYDDYTTNPQDFFHREYVIITDYNTKNFDKEIEISIDDMHDKHFSGRFRQNTNACDTYGECPFLELCLRGDDARFLYKVVPPYWEKK